MTTKTITIELIGADRRVLINSLNREWEHLQALKTELGIKIANERDADERADLTTRFDRLTAQQGTCDALTLALTA